MNKSLQQIQDEIDETLTDELVGYSSPLTMLAHMTEELGHIARDVNHYYGEKKATNYGNQQTLHEDMGDLLLSIICFANSLNVSLEEAYEISLKKVKKAIAKPVERENEDGIEN